MCPKESGDLVGKFKCAVLRYQIEHLPYSLRPLF